jgi:ribokinase
LGGCFWYNKRSIQFIFNKKYFQIFVLQKSDLKKKNMKYLTIGGAVQDVFFETKEGVLVDNKRDLLRQKLVGFEYGAKVNIENIDTQLGGGASNAAVCLARLGEKVATLVCLGKDRTAEVILENFKQNKVAKNLIQVSKKNTGMSSIVVYGQKTKDHILFTYRGANEDLKFDLVKIKKFNPDFIYVSSLSGEKWISFFDKLLLYKKKNNKFLVWNPGNLQIGEGAGKIKKYLSETDVLIVNKDEAIELLVKEKKDIGPTISIKKLLQYLAEFCPGIVVITAGQKGSFAFYQDKFFEQSVASVEKKDTTGVGDAFGSTFLWSLAQTDFDIQKSLKMASKNAASVITKKGAQNGLLGSKKIK